MFCSFVNKNTYKIIFTLFQVPKNVTTSDSSSGDDDIFNIHNKSWGTKTPLKKRSYEDCIGDSDPIPGPSHLKSKQQKISSFTDSTTTKEQEELSRLFSEAVYTSNCALSMFESEKWSKFFKKLRPAFTLPSRKQLSTTLLEKVYNDVRQKVNEDIQKSDAITLISDGWTNIRSEGIINYMVHTNNCDYFYDFSTPKSARHTGNYIAQEIDAIIQKIGNEKIVALVTDNASNMQAAWKILKNLRPNIQTYGCSAHILNLLMKDLEALRSFKDHMANSQEIVKYFKLKHVPNAILREKQGLGEQTPPTLKLPVETRWGSSVNCIKSIQANRQFLREAIIHPEVEGMAPTRIKNLILKDDVYWDRNARFIDLLSPVIDLISFMEYRGATVSDVRHQFFKLKATFEEMIHASPFLLTEEKKAIEIMLNRTKMACTDTHNAAYLLDPRYLGENLSSAELESAILLIQELSPEEDVNALVGEVTNFRSKANTFNRPILWSAAKNVKSVCKNTSDVHPVAWWTGWLKNSALYSAARKLLSMPASAASSERNWSTWGILHSKLRNRLTTSRAGKLVYIKFNLAPPIMRGEETSLNFDFSTDAEEEEVECPSDTDVQSDVHISISDPDDNSTTSTTFPESDNV